MNWAAKDYSEIALNQIWSEHVRTLPTNAGTRTSYSTATEPLPPTSSQVEKEASFFKMKTKFTANPCSSIEMNNGLGARVPFVTDKALSSPALSTLGVVVLQPARGIALPYALMHEYIRREAIAQEYDVYFYMHSDVTLGRGVVSEALRGLCVSTELHILSLC